MSDANQKTLHTYNKGVQQYIDGTVQVVDDSEQKEWLDFVFKDVPGEADILEIGSAFGREAQYLQSKGYRLTLTDASTGFVEYLQSHSFDATTLDIVQQQPEGTYDVILACAVFLHFTDEDFARAVRHVRDSLKSDGKFAFSLKQGDGEEWSNAKMDSPRYFNYWRRDKLTEALRELDMEIIDYQELSEGKWIHVVSKAAVQA